VRPSGVFGKWEVRKNYHQSHKLIKSTQQPLTMNDSHHQHKKQKMDNEGMPGSFAHAMMSKIDQLLDHTHSQTASIMNLQKELECLKEDLGKAQEERLEMKTKMERMFERVEHKQKYHSILLKNQKWEYSAPFPDDGSHPRLLKELRDCTCDMRYGRRGAACGSVIVDGGDEHYRRSFEKHWQEFSDALREYQFTLNCLHENDETLLHIQAVDLDPSVVSKLRDALRSTHFKSIVLSFVKLLDQTGAVFALDCVRNNPILENFCLTQVHADTILRPVVDHDFLCSIITVGKEKLRFLDLSYNYISTNGNTFIADYLATNPILQELGLKKNRLNDIDAGHIARALRHNTNLKYLNLERNDISYSGGEVLRKTEFDSTNLNTASDSNHNVYIELDNEGVSRSYNVRIVFLSDNHDPDHDQLMESIARACRWKKIFSILSARNRENSNGQHFSESKIPIALLPEMLTSIERYSEYFDGIVLDGEIVAPDRDSRDSSLLSVIYEVTRTWDEVIPLYESLGNTSV